jgi:excisionase family DNA binding protein
MEQPRAGTSPAQSITLSPEQLAAELGICRLSAYRLIKSGKIRAAKVGKLWRVSRVELDRFLTGGANAN